MAGVDDQMNHLVVNAFADELEKLARVGFLTRPSAGKMGRAALLGLGAGGAVAAAGTAHGMDLAAEEMTPEAVQMDRISDEANTRMMDNIYRGQRSGDLTTMTQALDRAPGLREAAEAGFEGRVSAEENALRSLLPSLGDRRDRLK